VQVRASPAAADGAPQLRPRGR